MIMTIYPFRCPIHDMCGQLLIVEGQVSAILASAFISSLDQAIYDMSSFVIIHLATISQSPISPMACCCYLVSIAMPISKN